jgi:dihydropteroate synthase
LPVAAEEQVRRVVPVIAALRKKSEVLISIDTSSAEVARAGLEAGADIINDITGLRGDPCMAALAARTRVGVVIMHMQGEPRTMQSNPSYVDVVAEVRAFFRERLEAAERAGISPEALVFDPGIGFGNTVAHNLALLAKLDSLPPAPDRPLLLGVSRKSFIGRVVGSESMADRHWPTVALTAWGRVKGARLFRVHDGRDNAHALRMTEAILSAGE